MQTIHKYLGIVEHCQFSKALAAYSSLGVKKDEENKDEESKEENEDGFEKEPENMTDRCKEGEEEQKFESPPKKNPLDDAKEPDLRKQALL